MPASKLTPDCVPALRNADGCTEKGAPLYWPNVCVSFGVQENGSKKRGVSWEVTDSLVGRALATWSTVDCGGGGHPSLKIYDLDRLRTTDGSVVESPIVCPVPEFNESAPNANVWMYRDDDWPYTNVPDTLALTTVTFDMTGRILDADVEINSFAANLTTSDTNSGVDLSSIITHEAGHFLGLSHEAFAHATMNAAYDAREPFDFRTLEADDVAGICTIYPPDRGAPDCHDRPTPLHGFTRFCADESDTATSRSELSMAGAGCACSLDQSNGRADAASLSLFAAASAVGARRTMKKRRRRDT